MEFDKRIVEGDKEIERVRARALMEQTKWPQLRSNTKTRGIVVSKNENIYV